MLQTALLASRRSVMRALRDEFGAPTPGAERGVLLVALSGGADSLALAAAAAHEAPRAGFRIGAVIVDHALQRGSAEVADRAARQATELGLDPVEVRRVEVAGDAGGDGPEAAARAARYAAIEEVAAVHRVVAVLMAHTRDDQAEQVLLGLARGSGARSLAGIPPRRALRGGAVVLRPFLAEGAPVTRAETEAACAEAALRPWVDPHNSDSVYTRVRVRDSVLPLLERELGPGIAAALARTADLAREDAEAFDAMIAEQIEEMVEHAEAGIAVSAGALAANPAALRHRIIRRIAEAEFGSELSREHTVSIAKLATEWRGQGPIEVPGITVARRAGRIEFARRYGSPRESARHDGVRAGAEPGGVRGALPGMEE